MHITFATGTLSANMLACAIIALLYESVDDDDNDSEMYTLLARAVGLGRACRHAPRYTRHTGLPAPTLVLAASLTRPPSPMLDFYLSHSSSQLYMHNKRTYAVSD